MANLVITGSRGTVGSIITPFLKKEHTVIELDRDNLENPVDILYDSLNAYFTTIDTIIHLAANPNPFIDQHEAEKNVEITRKIIDASKRAPFLKRIIHASSINVYPYRDIEQITVDTPRVANTFYHEGKPYHAYGEAKIEAEDLLLDYSKSARISLLNLRLGWVTKNNRHPPYPRDTPHPRDIEVALKHQDVIKIIDKSINFIGTANFVCISKKGSFIEEKLIFPL